MLDIKKFAVVFTEPESEETLIVEDQELIAHVHSERYAALFAAAPELLSVVNEFAAGACEADPLGMHSTTCRTCVARMVLGKIDPDANGLLH
jgi:hypothetical protein